ncbi:ECF transporter S component [Sporomusa sphaeroides]|uniref:ECF transporter S component n=1 Tax=Sporomusa sphaeroides TaxID=47679 RepID=UPI002BD428BB|nr:ECF transporter S component [Sporomusa sphaeroides]HML32939.1 ECF transporter S component [Sporomusa sphaeroides]
MSYTRKLINVAMFIALGVTLPVAFHLAGGTGSVFLPMHIPVLMAGLLLGLKGGLAVGMLTPFISSLTTGMPPLMPMLPIMVVELGVYGAAGGYLYRQCKLPLVWSLVGAMLAGRLAAAAVVAGLAAVLAVTLEPLPFIIGAVSTGLPGIVIQLLFVPLLVRKLEAVPGAFRRVKVHE